MVRRNKDDRMPWLMSKVANDIYEAAGGAFLALHLSTRCYIEF
jgi:hypothetical protein